MLATTSPRDAVRAPRESLDPRSLRALRTRIRGTVIEPSDVEYEARRRVWNTGFDRHPAAIVAAADPADVIRGIGYAREHDLEIAVRGGGHSVAGHSTADNALVIDLSAMKGLAIDPEHRVAWAEPGLTAGEYTEQAHAFGLASPFGDTASVGIAGITLGGGIGYLVRKHGLTIDSLVSAEVATADGRLVRASENENADLFWGIRGGGGNFGIVTGLELALHSVGTVYGGALLQPPTRDVLTGLVEHSAAAPRELSTIVDVMAAPPAPFVPEDARGRLVAATLGVHAGDLEAGARAFAPLRGLAAPIADLVGPMPYPAIYEYTRGAEARDHAGAVRTMFLDRFSDTVADIVIEYMSHATSPGAIAQIRALGGAMADVPAAATAFAHRDKAVMLTLIVSFVGPAPVEAHEAWLEAFWQALRPHASGAYVNFLANEGEARIREAYPSGTYERLAQVKARFDPDNVFHLNQNILPAR